jgi:hemerythrin
MPLVKWTNNFSVGIYVFDTEHMQLLSLVNDFYDAILAGIDERSVLAILNGLIKFTERHFAHEEEFFDVSGYPGAEAHRAEHRKLARELLTFRDVRLKQDIHELAIDLNVFLIKWFTEHTIGMDREFCAELRKLGVR